MNTDTITELVNEGHNILNTGFGLASDLNSGRTKVIYRSREGLGKSGGNDHFLASTELGKSTGWLSPVQVTKTGQFEEQDAKEFLAYVIPGHPDEKPACNSEFIFSVIDNVLNIRTRKDSNSTWSKNTPISDTNLVRTSIAATSIGQTLIVYGWGAGSKLVEFTCNVTAADKPWKEPVAVPGILRLANSKLGVTRTEKGICLLYSGAEQQIWWRHRDTGGKWGAVKAIITKDVQSKSPMAIMVIPYIAPPSNLTCPIPSKAPEPIHCYSIVTGKTGTVPKVEDPGKCNERFAVAYVDSNYTAHIQQIDEKGDSKGAPSRINRINAQTGNDRSGIFSLFIIPGVYPQTLTVVAISALHGRETLFTLSLVAPRQRVKEAAKSSALLDAALVGLNARFTALNGSHSSLVVAQAWLHDNVTSPEYIARAAGRDHLAIRYFLAAEEWNAAREAAWRAQVNAIKDYNEMVLSCYVSHMRPIRTEVRTIVSGQAVFPPITNGVLPDLN